MPGGTMDAYEARMEAGQVAMTTMDIVSDPPVACALMLLREAIDNLVDEMRKHDMSEHDIRVAVISATAGAVP